MDAYLRKNNARIVPLEITCTPKACRTGSIDKK